MSTDGTTGIPNKTNKHKHKYKCVCVCVCVCVYVCTYIHICMYILFQGVDLDHIALCDKQEVETVQIVAAPQGKAQQLHT